MKKTLIQGILILVSCTTLAACAELGVPFPDPGSSNRGVGAGTPNRGAGNARVTVVGSISQAEARRIARELGLSGFRPLPPGIARNLARGKALPPGIARQYPPESMLVRLPRLPDYEWHIAGKDLVLIAVGTLIVADIIFDVFSEHRFRAEFSSDKPRTKNP